MLTSRQYNAFEDKVIPFPRIIEKQQNKIQDKAKSQQKYNLCVDERQFVPKITLAAERI